jgi:hypothetical protein
LTLDRRRTTGYNIRMDLEEYEEELDAQEVYVEYEDWELYQ